MSGEEYDNKERNAQAERRAGAERRVRRTPPDEKGDIRNDAYAGPDRRQVSDRREYQQRQKQRIRSEKMAFLNRTTLSAGVLVAAALYAVVFLLAPEIRIMNDSAARAKEIAELDRRLAAEQPAPPSIGGAISRKIGEVENTIGAATKTVQDAASTLAAGAAPMAGVEDLLQLLSGMQALNRTEAGRATLAQAVVKLKAAVSLTNGDPASLDAAVGLAKKQDATLTALFSHIDDNHLGAAALLLALDDLRARIARQQPFADDLSLVATIAGREPAVKTALAALLPYADTGVTGREGLRQQLLGMAFTIVSAEVQGPDNDGSLKAEVLRRLSQYVKVRRSGDIAGKGAEAVVARAQLDLDGGDVPAALAELQTLQGSSAIAAAPLVAAAKGYVAADESSAILSQTILQVLSSAASGGGFSLESLVTALKTNVVPPTVAADPGAVPYMSPALQGQGGGNKMPSYDAAQ